MHENDIAYAQACHPPRWTVCGQRLEPLSMGHAILLQSNASPFMTGYPCGVEHLLAALWICSRPVIPGVDTMQRKLPLRWRVGGFLLSVMMIRNRERVFAAIEMMLDYVREATAYEPPIAKKEQKVCRTSSAPSYLPMKRALMNHYGYTEERVLNMPLQQAKWEHCGWLEHAEAIRFADEKDRDFITRSQSEEVKLWLDKMPKQIKVKRAVARRN